jgi:ribonuclease HI
MHLLKNTRHPKFQSQKNRSGQVEGTKTSYKAETMAVYQALRLLKEATKSNIFIYADNESMIKSLTNVIYSPDSALKKPYRLDSVVLWKGIAELIKTRQRDNVIDTVEIPILSQTRSTLRHLKKQTST